MMEPAVIEGDVSDLEAIAEIYAHYALTSIHTFDVEPKSRTWWEEWFTAFGEGRYQLLVARLDDVVAGYAWTGPYRDRPAYEPSVSTSIYVDPARVGQGIGTALYDRLIPSLAERDVHRAYAAIALPNPSSIALHERFGFRKVGHFSEQGRKFGCYVDVAWYELPC